MNVETAPTANNALVKKEETPGAELNHCRKALVDRNTRWCCCTLTKKQQELDSDAAMEELAREAQELGLGNDT